MENYLSIMQTTIEDTVNLFALAQTYYVGTINKKQLQIYPCFKKEITERIHEILIKNLLAIATNVRFLDDKTKILKRYGREPINIGSYKENNIDKTIDIRNALNKLIHHESISVQIYDHRVTLVLAKKDEVPNKEVSIPTGAYTEVQVLIEVGGTYNNNKWNLSLDLFQWLEEILRIFYNYKTDNNSNKKNSD